MALHSASSQPGRGNLTGFEMKEFIDKIGTFYLKCEKKVNGFFHIYEGHAYAPKKSILSRSHFLDYT